VVVRLSIRRLVLAVWAIACAAILTASLWPAPELVRTEDQNHDGRPDIWRFYDRQGRLTRVEIDTNFDGRPDHRDFYREGTLTRSELDRNFDNRVDLIEEFDRSGRQHVRSVVDTDFDGAADLMVLFRDGEPIHSEWTAPVRAIETAAHGGVLAASGLGVRVPVVPPLRAIAEPLTPLDNPFGASASVRAGHYARAPDVVGLSPISLTLGLPTPSHTFLTIAAGRLAPIGEQHPRNLTLLAFAGRAPPRAPVS
jgi:hypothetical protein